MEKPNPIKLPEELEKEAEVERLRVIQERIKNDRKNNTLVSGILSFLKEFEVKVTEINQYLMYYAPYPTISQTIKDVIRNKLRTVNEFYYSYTGSNPHELICECLEKNSTETLELQAVHTRLGELLTRLNNNVLCISNKRVIFVAQRKPKEQYDWNQYDWT